MILFYKKSFLLAFKNELLSQIFIRLLFIPIFILPSTFYDKSGSWDNSAFVRFIASLLCLGALQRFGTFHSSGLSVYFAQYCN